MPRQVLWAPWRMAYVSEGAPDAGGCIFCKLPVRGDLRENLVLEVGPHAVVLLNRYPYSNGHLMVAPRAHVAGLHELDAGAYAALMEAVRGAEAGLRQALRPEGMNVGINLGRVAGAGIADHLHWHLVPRWGGDTNFMPVIGEVKVMPQHLAATYDLLRPHFGAAPSSSRRPRSLSE